MKDTYKTIDKPAEGYFKDKGSKFYAFAVPVQNENEIKEAIAGLKKQHHSARHHCYAWRLGTEDIIYRANDDGEPPSTAGKPVLGQLLNFDLTNIIVVVVRYFGGTLLGTGGLINAYRKAAADAIKNAEIKTKIVEQHFQLSYSYKQMNDVMSVLKQENLNITTTRFEEECSLVFAVRKSKAERIEKIFSDFYGVKISKSKHENIC
ncbi:MAG: YigZ family protein [Prolixibacteraceae bacterium]